MNAQGFRRLALALSGAREEPHFDRTSFRAGKRIFATMTRDGVEVMIPVRPIETCLALLASDPGVFIDHGGWTRRYGSLGIRLARAPAGLVASLLEEAHARVTSRAPRGKPVTARAPARRPSRKR
jgi:hypothetical protein